MNNLYKNEVKEQVIEYVDRVFFFCIKRVKNRMDAEDLAQTIILEVLKSIEKGLVPANFDFYIWGVCRNQYNMYLRRVIKDRENIEYFEEITIKDDGAVVVSAPKRVSIAEINRVIESKKEWIEKAKSKQSLKKIIVKIRKRIKIKNNYKTSFASSANVSAFSI